MELNTYIDHTLLKATATILDIKILCNEAKKYKFYAVCVNSSHIALAKKELKGSKVNLAAVVGFPLGAKSTASKVFEAKDAIKNGANEIDMVMNIGWLKSGKYILVKEEISQVKKAIGSHILKVIIETCYLTNDEKVKACELVIDAKADYIKTSTGFGTGNANLEDVKLMKSIVKDKVLIKASGGIKTTKNALEYIKTGASRIGTSSGISLVTTK